MPNSEPPSEERQPESYSELARVQQIVLDVLKVDRNHRIPGEERRENVVEHSFSVAMQSWRIHEALGLDLSLEKILKYAQVHDFPERGLSQDINTFADPEQRRFKEAHEQEELNKIIAEFPNFEDFTKTLVDYRAQADEEALFVWSVDKMQAIILGEIDDWRPYIILGISYDAFCAKNEELLAQCSPHVSELFAEVIERGKQTYYDRPSE